MSDTPWTPGPWEAVQDGGGATCIYAGSARLGKMWPVPDARLAALAPEMADALQGLPDILANAHARPIADVKADLDAHADVCRALLARARGAA